MKKYTLLIIMSILSIGLVYGQGTPCAAVDITNTSPLNPAGSPPSGGSVTDGGTALTNADHCAENNTTDCAYYYYQITVPYGMQVDFTLAHSLGLDRDIEGSIYESTDETCNNLDFANPLDCEFEGDDGDGQVNLSVTNLDLCSKTYWIRVSDFRCNANNSWTFSYTVTAADPIDDPGTSTSMMTPTSGAPASLGGLAITNGSQTNSSLNPCYTIPEPTGCSAPASGDWVGGPNAEDIWVAVTVPASGGLVIEQNSTGATAIAAYETTSGTGAGTQGPFDTTTTFEQLGCDSDGNPNASFADGKLVLSCLTPGDVIYLRIWDDNSDGSPTASLTVTDITDAGIVATGDEPTDAIPLVIGAPATGVVLNSTLSESHNFPDPSCGEFNSGNLCEDIWYEITAPASPVELCVTGSTAHVGMAIYTSPDDDPCNPGFSELTCPNDDVSNPTIYLSTGLGYTAGDKLYVRVWDETCDQDRSFSLQAKVAPVLLNSANDGETFSLDCGVALPFYDSGGPGDVDGTTDYGHNEDNTVTFCADAGQVVRISFLNKFNSTVSSGTFYRPACDGTHAFDVDAGGNSSGLDGDLADYMTLYDGATTGASIIAVYTGETLSYPSPGTVVSSGTCLTVNFKTSDIIKEEGWEAVVECIDDVTPISASINCAAFPSGSSFSDDNYNSGVGNTDIQADDQYIVTYCPSDPQYCAFVGNIFGGFATLNLNQNVDYLYVYNGIDDTSSPIAIFTGTGDNNLTGTENITNITGVTAFEDYTPANTGGCLTFKLVSNNSTNYPDWTTVTGFDLPIECVTCDLGDGGGTDCATATPITEDGYWAGTSVDDYGDGHDPIYNPTGGDLDEDNGDYTNGCVAVDTDAGGNPILVDSEITRLENTIWYRLTTPDICEEADLTFTMEFISCQNERDDDNGVQFTIWEGPIGSPNTACPTTGDTWDDTADYGTNNGTSGFNMFGCFDKLTAGYTISVSGIVSNTDYMIMIDGFTGQHCFMDFYVDIYPTTITNMQIDDAGDPAEFCSLSTETAELSATASNSDIEFVYDPVAYTTLVAAQAAVDGARGYDDLANDALGTSLEVVTPVATAAPGVNEVTTTIAGTDFPANTTCDIQVYNIYAISQEVPVDGLGDPLPYSGGADASPTDCFPFVVAQVVIYPIPEVTTSGVCNEFTFSSTCGFDDLTLTVGGTAIANGAEGDPMDLTAFGGEGTEVSYTIENTAFPSCASTGTIILGTDCIVPVELVGLEGYERNGKVLLEWETVSETNNSHFVVERSYEGRDYEKIGSVKGAGTTSVPQFYDFVDERPQTGKNYYRLKQVDFDGNFEYSNVVTIDMRNGKLITKVFPSPTRDILNIESSKEIIHISIIDIAGRIVMDREMTGATNTQLDVSALQKGIYYIEMKSEQEVSSTRFVKE